MRSPIPRVSDPMPLAHLEQDVDAGVPMVNQPWHNAETNNLANDPRFPEWRIQIFEVCLSVSSSRLSFAVRHLEPKSAILFTPPLSSLFAGLVTLDAAMG